MQTQMNVVFSCAAYSALRHRPRKTAWLAPYRVFELRVDLGDDFSHRVQFGKHVFLRGLATSHHGGHLNRLGEMRPEEEE